MRDATPIKWLDEHDDVLREELAKGHSLADAAIELNSRFGMAITRNAAIGRASRMGIKSKTRGGDNMKRIVKPKLAPKIKPKLVAGPIRIEQPRMVREDAEIRCAAIEPRHLTLLELKSKDCRYPYGDSPEPITFCGHPQQEASSYCPAHRALIMRPLHFNTGRERPDFSALLRHSGSGQAAPTTAARLGVISDLEDAAS